tara:strand:- start:7 stop:405 length:399 start_codon:yes stop_codon:yes gene_type:complete
MTTAAELCIQSRGPHCLLALIAQCYETNTKPECYETNTKPECKKSNTKPEWLLSEEDEAAREISTHKKEVEDLKEIIEDYKTKLEHMQNKIIWLTQQNQNLLDGSPQERGATPALDRGWEKKEYWLDRGEMT